jgi:polar amino acid transport system substrate-binding protein
MRTRFSTAISLLALAASVPAPSSATADVLDEVHRTRELHWCGDEEGGGPYVYPREADPGEVTGFEVEIAARLAGYLHAEARFAQSQWDRMPEMVRTGKCQIILNGYEWTPARAEAMEPTIPYYVYSLRLLARRDDATLDGWTGLERPAHGRLRKVGALTGSAAEEYLRKRFGDRIEIASYDGSTDSMREVETGKLDATLQDTPIVSFYAPRFPRLRPVGEAVGRGYYVVYARKGETALVHALDEAIVGLVRSGELERLYRRYGMWDEWQRELATIADAGKFYGLAAVVRAAESGGAMPSEEEVRAGERRRGWDILRDTIGVLLRSAGLTVLLSVASFPIAVVLGLAIALGRLYGPGWLRAPLAVWVEVLRGTPLMLQLYFIFFFLPEVGVAVPALWTGILGLAVNYSAYESEIYRAGLQAIPPGQMEAALALGMSRPLALRRVIVPQAVRIVVPPVVNDFIALFKDTSVCSVVTLVELTKRFSVLSQSTQATAELMAVTALLYLLMSYPLSAASRRLEHGRQQAAPA